MPPQSGFSINSTITGSVRDPRFGVQWSMALHSTIVRPSQPNSFDFRFPHKYIVSQRRKQTWLLMANTQPMHGESMTANLSVPIAALVSKLTKLIVVRSFVLRGGRQNSDKVFRFVFC